MIELTGRRGRSNQLLEDLREELPLEVSMDLSYDSLRNE